MANTKQNQKKSEKPQKADTDAFFQWLGVDRVNFFPELSFWEKLGLRDLRKELDNGL